MTTPLLIIFSTVVSLIGNMAVLLSPSRLSYAGGDIFHNIWTYKRNWVYLTSFDSNFLNQIQYPTHGSAFTAELQIGNTLLFKFLNSLFSNDINTYSAMLFISGFLVFYSVFKIAKSLGSHEAVGLMIATYATTAMYLSNHISHLQVTSFYWLTIPVWLTFELSKSDPAFRKFRKVVLFITILFLFSGPSYLNAVLCLSILISIFVLVLLTLIKSENFKIDFLFHVRKASSFFKSSYKVIGSAALIALFFWIPYILQVIENDSKRTIAQVSAYRVDLSQFLNPSSGNWLYGQHNVSNFSLTGDSLFPGLVVFLLILLGVFSARFKIASPHCYFLWSGLFLILISLTSPVTLFGYGISPNPVFLFVAKIGALSATRYLPTLAFFGLLLVLLATASKINFFDSWKHLKTGFTTLLICTFIIIENIPSNALILPLQPRLSSNWTTLKPVLMEVSEKFIGIYPGPSLPLNPVDPLFWTQFEWMAGMAEVPLEFIGGNTGFFSDQSLEFMAKVQRQENLRGLPLKSCLIRKECLLIVDKNGLKQFNSSEQIEYIHEQAKNLSLPIKDLNEFMVIGFAGRK